MGPGAGRDLAGRSAPWPVQRPVVRHRLVPGRGLHGRVRAGVDADRLQQRGALLPRLVLVVLDELVGVELREDLAELDRALAVPFLCPARVAEVTPALVVELPVELAALV